MWYDYNFADGSSILCCGMDAEELIAAINKHGLLISIDRMTNWRC